MKGLSFPRDKVNCPVRVKCLYKGGFPLSRNFNVRTCVKFTFADKIEAMYERSRVNVKS